VWSAIVRDGAAVGGARLGDRPLPQTTGAHGSLPGRHRLVRVVYSYLADKPTVSSLMIPLVYCHIKSFQ
jgi:hypothetical protein